MAQRFSEVCFPANVGVCPETGEPNTFILAKLVYQALYRNRYLVFLNMG